MSDIYFDGVASHSIQKSDGKVVIVGLVGKCRYSLHSCKASILNPLINHDVFQGSMTDDSGAYTVQDAYEIEGYYDRSEHVIYLHLRTLQDLTTLHDLCQQATAEISNMKFTNFYSSAEMQHAKALLFFFSVCHVIIVHEPSCSFDISWVRLFRTLDAARLKTQQDLSSLLAPLSLSKEWTNSGRLCSPRVLFVFETSVIDLDTHSDHTTKHHSQKTPPLKRLQHALEDQIYRILRKSRIITNISNNSLFAVPANQEFVYVFHKQSKEDLADPASFYLSHLSSASEVMKNGSYQSSGRASRAHTVSGDRKPVEQNSFHQFLSQHIKLALTKGFDDNVGRNPVPAYFELPVAKTWLAAAEKLWKFFMNTDDAKSSINTSLKSLVQIDIRFSEARCLKVLPLAESAYQEGLPPHYTTSYHDNKLAQAKLLFTQHARGIACEKYLHQLEKDCEKIWKNGRQLCEEISLIGNHCVNELHRVAEDAETEDNKHLPVKSHSSQVKTKAACNCGRKQADRDDPFTHKAANYEFYEKLAISCCSDLEQYKLPVFQPSTPEAKAAYFKIPRTTTPSKPRLISVSEISEASGDTFEPETSLQGSQESYHGNSQASQDREELVTVDTEIETEKIEEIVEVKDSTGQHSTTEYLPGMIHTESPPGLLPVFPSWSLICLGKYSSYNPSLGVDQPGFLHCCNFLLPWEIAIHGDKDRWPSIDTTKKSRPRKAIKDMGEMAVVIYIGHEYECPRGHRFFCSTPEKIFKAPPTGQFKENAYKIITQDAPLYFPCQCRNTKGSVAQLMRLHLVVPEGPLHVELKPLIQPGPSPCPLFHPGSDGALVLPSSGHWVLRLPYIYMGENGPYIMPTNPQQLMACRMLKGLYNFQQINQSSKNS